MGGDRSSAPADAILYRDQATSRAWLDFGGKPDTDQIAELKAEGWRYSGYRQMWHNPRKYVASPAGITTEEGGFVAFSEERADRTAATADKVQAAAQGQLERANALADMIPFGQPILVGHHSEKGHRRHVERMQTAMTNGVQGMQAAEALDARAQSRSSAKSRSEDVGVLQRRIKRLEAEKRSITQGVNRWGVGPMRDERIAALDAEIADATARIEALGGVRHLNYKPGDIVAGPGLRGRVESIGPKNVRVADLGPSGFVLSYDTSNITRIVTRAEDLTPEQHAAITGHISSEHNRRRAYTPTQKVEGIEKGLTP